MSGVASGKKTKDTKLRIQQIQNVNDAIDFAKKVGVDFTKIRISAEGTLMHATMWSLCDGCDETCL